MKKIDVTGQVFSFLTVVGESSERNKQGRHQWECVCECGNTTNVRGSHLRRGDVISCGCQLVSSPRHGHTLNKGASPTYNSWTNMKARCSNPAKRSYDRYGGRGISVCDRWLNFANFLEDMGLKPEGTVLDRIDHDGNYEPSNCRWATPAEGMNRS